MGFSFKAPKAPEIPPPPPFPSVAREVDPQNAIGNAAMATQLPKPDEVSTKAILDLAPGYPDVAKTPSPTGVTPIPYPNIGPKLIQNLIGQGSKLQADMRVGLRPGRVDDWCAEVRRMKDTLVLMEGDGRLPPASQQNIARARANLERLQAELERMKTQDEAEDRQASKATDQEATEKEATEALSTAYETMSSVMKAFHEAQMASIRKIGA